MMRKIYKVYNERKFEVKRSMRIPGSIPGLLFLPLGHAVITWPFIFFFFRNKNNAYNDTLNTLFKGGKGNDKRSGYVYQYESY